MKLSVVIPTCDRPELLRRTLPALKAQAMSGDMEVLLVADGSLEATEAVLQSCGVPENFYLLRTARPHMGAAAARNVGIRAARGELILFLDDDFLAPPDLFEQHLRAHDGSAEQVVFGPVSVDDSSAPTLMRYLMARRDREWYGALDASMQLRFPEPEPRDLTITVLSFLVNASVARRHLLAVDGFDESLPSAEDLDLGLRLWKHGLAFRYCPQAAVREIYVKTARQHLVIQSKAMLGDLRVARKHPEHRPYALLAAFAEAGAAKRWLRRCLMTSPLSPVPLLAAPLSAERLLVRWRPLRAAATLLLQAAERAERLRTALRDAGSWSALEAEFCRSLPVLMYHRVGPLSGGLRDFLTVSPRNFERQMRWLARHGYTAITSAEWLAWRRDGRGLPEKPVMITFDDGYEETARLALPVLRRFHFRAVIFLATGLLGKQNEWDRLRGAEPLELMSADSVREWDAAGIEFAAHSRTHADLTALSPEEALQEIRGSRQDLELLLGHSVLSFAYPYGRQNEAVQQMVRQEFALGFSIQEGVNTLQGDSHMLRRAYVGPYDTLFEFARIVRHGGLGKLRSLRGRLGLRRGLRALLKFLNVAKG